MCVPEIYWDDCIDMRIDSSKRGIPISCISGRDRYECIDKVGRREADVVALDPEDMYLAARHELAHKAQYNIVEQVFLFLFLRFYLHAKILFLNPDRSGRKKIGNRIMKVK